MDGKWGITEIDLTDPLIPRRTGLYPTPGVASKGVIGPSNLLYVADFCGIEIFRYDTSTDVVSDPAILPRRFSLSQNYPNPFNATTTIDYEVLHTRQITIDIMNILGQRVRSLVYEIRGPGVYQAVWDGKNDTGKEVSSGVYLCRLKTHDFGAVVKMVLLK